MNDRIKINFHALQKFLYAVLYFLLPAFVFLIIGFLILELSFYRLKLIAAEITIFSLVLFLMISLIPSKKHRRSFFIFGYLIMVFLVFIQTSYYYLYNYNISASTVFILIESNFGEAAEYLQAYSSGFNLILIITLFLPLLFFRKITPYINELKPSKGKGQIVYFALIILLVSIYFYKNLENYNLFGTAFNAYNQYIKQSGLYDEFGLDKSVGEFKEVISGRDSKKQIFVLVIGESTTRHRMGLYNYVRQTNPELSKIKEKLAVFNDVISPHTHTIPSLSKILTLNNYEDDKRLQTGTIVQLMNQSGFNTHWISNQKPVGVYENLITKIARASNKTHFLNTQNFYIKSLYDEVVLTPLEEVLKEEEGNLFIVVHLLGTHVGYGNRFPNQFEVFSGKAPLIANKIGDGNESVNQYDNAILYNDKIIADIINLVKKEEVSSYVLYFSDHGEDVFQVNNQASHTETEGTYPMYDVPFVLWTSEEFDKKDHRNYNLSREYMLDDLIHSIADLSGIKFKSFEPQRSIFSDSFNIRKRVIFNKKVYDSIFRR